MAMKRRTTVLALAAVGAALVAGSTAWWWFGASKPLHNAALPPRRVPSEGEKLLAALINVVDADMRSLELGRWYVRRLQAAARRLPFVDCATVVDAIDYGAIARDVPRANDVTRREIEWLLRQLVREAAAECSVERVVETDRFVGLLDAYAVLAFDRDHGLLWGMPGYSRYSRLPLP